MNIKKNCKILNEAIRKGCKTASDLAQFLKLNAKHQLVNQ